MRFRVLSLAALLIAISIAFPAHAQRSYTVYGVTGDNTLVQFTTGAPGTLVSSQAITGLGDGERVVGIDFRPANGQLLAVTSSSRLAILNPMSGGATVIGGTLNPNLNGGAFGFDFNPTVDRIRLVSDAAQNLRLNPNNGAVAAVDGGIAYAAADRNAGTTPALVGSAYTNNFGTAGTTTLYNIDAAADALVLQNPPNNGVLNTIGALGIDAGTNTGFDIISDALGSDAAFAAIGGTFYSINLANGAATAIGALASAPLVGIAITGSTSPMAAIPLCGDFDGSTSPVVRAVFPGAPVGGGNAFCRILAENRQLIGGQAGAQIGDGGLLSRGVIQAVDVFVSGGAGNPRLSAPAQICLLGDGVVFYRDATGTPRVSIPLDTTFIDGYTCGFIPNAGTLVMVNP
jgi:hypothetical protein